MDEHLFIVTYDISDPKRWRAVFSLMNGYGEWLQLSVFQCRLARRRHAELAATLDQRGLPRGMGLVLTRRHAELAATLDQIIHHEEDHVLMLDLGPAEGVVPRVVSLGKPFRALERAPIIV